jgi:lipase chaperone LimK
MSEIIGRIEQLEQRAERAEARSLTCCFCSWPAPDMERLKRHSAVCRLHTGAAATARAERAEAELALASRRIAELEQALREFETRHREFALEQGRLQGQQAAQLDRCREGLTVIEQLAAAAGHPGIAELARQALGA